MGRELPCVCACACVCVCVCVCANENKNKFVKLYTCNLLLPPFIHPFFDSSTHPPTHTPLTHSSTPPTYISLTPPPPHTPHSSASQNPHSLLLHPTPLTPSSASQTPHSLLLHPKPFTHFSAPQTLSTPYPSLTSPPPWPSLQSVASIPPTLLHNSTNSCTPSPPVRDTPCNQWELTTERRMVSTLSSDPHPPLPPSRL